MDSQQSGFQKLTVLLNFKDTLTGLISITGYPQSEMNTALKTRYGKFKSGRITLSKAFE